MNSLKKIKIGDILELITDYHSNGAYKKLKENVELLDKENYAVMIRTLNFERQDFKDDLLYVTKKAYDFLEKSSVIPNDILMNKIANAGSVYIMPDMQKPVTCGMNLFLIRFNDTVNQRYMYYNMKNVEQYIKSFAHGTTTTTITKDEVRNIDLYIHSKKEQGKIEKLLTSIDKKIENDKKINSELESMAKTIYDYWFLQFEFPNEEGKPYKSSGGKMVWNEELGREIPEGWEVRTLESIESNIVTGKTPSTKNKSYYNGKIPFITIADIRGTMHVVKTAQTLSIEGANSQKNKYIPSGAICVTCIASPGLVGFASKDSQTNQQINSVVCKHEYNKMFLYYSIENYFKFSSGAKTGNTFDNMNKNDFASIKITYPSIKELELYHKETLNIYKNILNNSKENEELISLRDFLLPLLMNGQVGFKENINVKEIEVGKEEVLT